MRQIRLGKRAIGTISRAVDEVFDRASARLLGASPWGKQLAISFAPQTSLTALFNDAAKHEGVEPREEILRSLLKVASSYLNAHRERAKAKVLHGVQTALIEAQTGGAKTDFTTILGGKLADLMQEVKADIKRVAVTEAVNTTNTSTYDAIGRIGAVTGREDPTVYFVCVHDAALCDECKRLHLLADEVTPRLWRISELGAGYHKKGDPNPKISGLHPHERCSLTHLLPGYGFDAAGKVTYVTRGHDELANQRGGVSLNPSTD
jgi:hypothetical protein